MNTVAWLALAVAGPFAVANWVSRASDNRRLEYVTKPTTTALLVVFALVLDAGDPTQRAWFVAALVLSLAGDVFLMLPPDGRFVEGLASFLLAHLAFVAGFAALGVDSTSVAIGAIFAVVILPAVLAPILNGARAADRRLTIPVLAYFLAIGAMIVMAIGSGNAMAGFGAVLFALSDSMIGWNRFVKPFAASGVAIMVTYHVAQALLAGSLVS